MPPVIRRLFTILSLLSLLLCIAVVVLWVRSYFVSDHILSRSVSGEGPWTSWTLDWLCTGRGGIGFQRIAPSPASPYLGQEVEEESGSRRPLRRETGKPEYPQFDINDRTTLGFNFRRSEEDPAFNYVRIVVPLWSLFILFSLLPCLWFWRWHAARRRIRCGHCPTCSYDLRAHKPGDRCPECGAIIPDAVAPNSAEI